MTPTRLLPLLALMLATTDANAANEYTPLQKARRFAEVERLAGQKLAADPTNADALIAKAGAIMAYGDEQRIEEAVKLAEACVAAHPKSSACQNTLGEVLGSKAQMGSMISALGYASRIRDGFAKAVELDPRNWQARANLISYYIAAPSIAGGGKDKAATVVADTTRTSAEAGRALQARMDLMNEKIAEAEAGLLAMNPGNDEVLQQFQRDLLFNVALQYGGHKKPAEAERTLRELARRFPDSDLVPLGQARLLQEQGKNAEAVPWYEKAIAIDARPTTWFRLGKVLQAINDKARAAKAFEQALVQKVGLSKKMRSEAEEALKAVRS